jgi:hypothetical protein
MKKMLLLLMMMVLLAPAGFAQVEVCLNEDEVALANLVNQLRKQNDREIVSLSASLSYVADVHVKDLYLHHNPLGQCNLLSWSDKGRWTACCIEGSNLECMHDKPFELTQYKSKGYELIFYQNTQVTSGLAFNAWKESAQAQKLILQQGRYSDKQWQAMGVAIFDGYASIWFGELIDKAGEPLSCDEMQKRKEKQKGAASDEKATEGKVQYYVIVASHRNEKDAQKEIAAFQEQDYEAITLKSGSNYRVAVGPYDGFDNATKIKEALTTVKRKPWILKADEE